MPVSLNYAAALHAPGMKADERLSQRHGDPPDAWDAGCDGGLQEVGDDVYGDDPTVNRLQAVMAERFGFETALFFPTGTQSNLAALMAHCGLRRRVPGRPGSPHLSV